MVASILAGIEFAWTALKLAYKYGPEVVELYKAIQGVVQSIQDKIKERQRNGKVKDASETKNPDDLEKSFRTGGGGA